MTYRQTLKKLQVEVRRCHNTRCLVGILKKVLSINVFSSFGWYVSFGYDEHYINIMTNSQNFVNTFFRIYKICIIFILMDTWKPKKFMQNKKNVGIVVYKRFKITCCQFDLINMLLCSTKHSHADLYVAIWFTVFTRQQEIFTQKKSNFVVIHIIRINNRIVLDYLVKITKKNQCV